MQINKIMGKVMQFLPKTEGAAGRIHLGEKQIGELLKQGGSGQEVKALKELVGSIKKPSIDVVFKAKSNYTIAGLQLKDGKDVVGRTTVSVVNAGSKKPIVKARASIGEGRDILYANGFLDVGQPANSRDLAIGLTQKDGIIKANATISKAAGAHVQLNGDKGIDLAKKLLNGDEIISKYDEARQGLDQALSTAREWLSGGATASVAPWAKSPEKVAKVTEKAPLIFGAGSNAIEKGALKTSEQVAKVTEKSTGMRGFETLKKQATHIAPDAKIAKVSTDRKLKAFKINEFGEVEYVKAANALKGKSATKALTAAERFKEAFGVTRRTYMNRLKKAHASGDSVKFEELRAEMGKKGYQPYFDRHTGALKIMEGARNIDDVIKKMS